MNKEKYLTKEVQRSHKGHLQFVCQYCGWKKKKYKTVIWPCHALTNWRMSGSVEVFHWEWDYLQCKGKSIKRLQPTFFRNWNSISFPHVDRLLISYDWNWDPEMLSNATLLNKNVSLYLQCTEDNPGNNKATQTTGKSSSIAGKKPTRGPTFRTKIENHSHSEQSKERGTTGSHFLLYWNWSLQNWRSQEIQALSCIGMKSTWDNYVRYCS